MKRISTVLLIMVLVGSVAFASFTGSAAVEFGFDLDSKEYGFKNSNAVDIEIELHKELAGKKGEGDVYAEINASMKVVFALDGVFTDAPAITPSIKLDSAKIVGDGWFVSILGALDGPSFAKSAIDLDDGDPIDFLKPAPTIVKVAGVQVGFSGYTVGLSLPNNGSNDIDDKLYNVMVAATTPEYEVADGVKVGVGGSAVLSNAVKAVSGSVKGSYDSDDFAVAAQADMLYNVTLETFDAEAAVNVAIDPVVVDLYFLLKQDGTTYKEGDNVLSVKATGVVVDGLKVTVTGRDLLNATALSAAVDYTVSDEIAVGANGGYTVQGSAKGDWKVGGKVVYTADMFKASADATYSVEGAVDTLKFNAKVESTKLVDGATLSLGYASGNYLASPAALGSITAKAEIAF